MAEGKVFACRNCLFGFYSNWKERIIGTSFKWIKDKNRSSSK
jgi:hypothetical protein